MIPLKVYFGLICIKGKKKIYDIRLSGWFMKLVCSNEEEKIMKKTCENTPSFQQENVIIYLM